MTRRSGNSSLVTEFWILFSVFCSSAGWILSALMRLNSRGYGVAVFIGVAAGAWWWWRRTLFCRRWPCWPKLRRRFSRLTPAIFLIFALIALVAGILYPPNCYDALAYRV